MTSIGYSGKIPDLEELEIKFVYFDIDGTAQNIEGLKCLFKEAGKPRIDCQEVLRWPETQHSEIDKPKFLTWNDFYNLFFAVDPIKYRHEFSGRMRSDVEDLSGLVVSEHVVAMPYLDSAVDSMHRKGIAIGFLSNVCQRFQQTKLKNSCIDDIADGPEIYTSDFSTLKICEGRVFLDTFMKPSINLYRYALEKAQGVYLAKTGVLLRPNQIALVDDSLKNVIGASQSEMTGIHFHNGLNNPTPDLVTSLKHGIYRIDSLNQLDQ
ncbi:HAD family hydrolase [Candidatus Woesearchaeota archaeon]|nr:HAD family hydrolase [Candidatus Woesearchaeota archaeon]